MTDELARAYATLCQGAAVFATWLSLPDRPMGERAVPHGLRSKVIGNGLRELDRFLNIFVGEVSCWYGLPSAPAQRNTANKLRELRVALGLARDDHDRLIALGRSRNCLLYCGGMVMRGDVRDPGMMTLGWSAGPGEEGPLRRIALGRAIIVEQRDLECTGRFYRQVADALVPNGIA